MERARANGAFQPFKALLWNLRFHGGLPPCDKKKTALKPVVARIKALALETSARGLIEEEARLAKASATEEVSAAAAERTDR